MASTPAWSVMGGRPEDSRPGSAFIQREAAASRLGSASIQRGRPGSASLQRMGMPSSQSGSGTGGRQVISRPSSASIQQMGVPSPPVESRPGSASIRRGAVPLSPVGPIIGGRPEGNRGEPGPGSPFQCVSPGQLRREESPRRGSPLQGTSRPSSALERSSSRQGSPLRSGSPRQGRSPRPSSALERNGSRQGSPRRDPLLQPPTLLALARQGSTQTPDISLSPSPRRAPPLMDRRASSSSAADLSPSPRRAPPLMDRRASSSSAADFTFVSPVIIEPLLPQDRGFRLPPGGPAEGDEGAEDADMPQTARRSSPDRLLLARSPSTIPADMLQTMLGVYEGLFRTA